MEEEKSQLLFKIDFNLKKDSFIILSFVLLYFSLLFLKNKVYIKYAKHPNNKREQNIQIKIWKIFIY